MNNFGDDDMFGTKPAIASVTIWSDLLTLATGALAFLSGQKEVGISTVLAGLLGLLGRKGASKRISGIITGAANGQ